VDLSGGKGGRSAMKFRNTLILLIVVLILFAFVYVFEIREPKESNGKSENLGKILIMEKQDVNKVELSYSDPNYESIVSSKDESGQWQIEKPINAKVDQKIMDKLISDALSKIVHRTLENPGELSEYGLDKPRVTAAFHPQSGASKTINMGNTVPTGNYVYVKQSAESDIYLVPASIVDDMTKFVSDLRDRSIISLSRSDLQRIQINYADGKNITCEKKNLEWSLVEPISAKADNSEVEKLISDLYNLKVDRFIDQTTHDLSDFGLGKPLIEVIITLEDGKEIVLSLGNKENGLIYIKRSSDEQVFLVDSEMADKLTKQPSDLRDRTVISFQENSVEKLELEYPDRSILVEKKSDGEEITWQIVKPVNAKADKQQIEEMLKMIQGLKADEFVSDNPTDTSKYGLTQPQIRLTISPKDSDNIILLVGDKSGGSVYVKTGSSNSVYLMDASIAGDLDKKVLHLRDKQVMKFQQNDAKRIELRRKDEIIVCIKQERDWRLIEPVKEKAKNYEINDIIRELGDLKAERFVAEKAGDLQEYGLSQPEIEVIVTLEDDSGKILLVGKNLPDVNSAYAKTGDMDVIFVIGGDILEELGKSVEDIREQ
jgi:hypothetical protein